MGLVAILRHHNLTQTFSCLFKPDVEGEGGLAGVLDQKKALSVILHIKQALDGV